MGQSRVFDKCSVELPNDEVSDTTDDHSSNAAGPIIILFIPVSLLRPDDIGARKKNPRYEYRGNN